MIIFRYKIRYFNKNIDKINKFYTKNLLKISSLETIVLFIYEKSFHFN